MRLPSWLRKKPINDSVAEVKNVPAVEVAAATPITANPEPQEDSQNIAGYLLLRQNAARAIADLMRNEMIEANRKQKIYGSFTYERAGQHRALRMRGTVQKNPQTVSEFEAAAVKAVDQFMRAGADLKPSQNRDDPVNDFAWSNNTLMMSLELANAIGRELGRTQLVEEYKTAYGTYKDDGKTLNRLPPSIIINDHSFRLVPDKDYPDEKALFIDIEVPNALVSTALKQAEQPTRRPGT